MTGPQYGPPQGGGWQPPADGTPAGYDPYAQPQQPVQYEQPYAQPAYDPYAQQQPQQPAYDPNYPQQQYDPNAYPMSAPPMSAPPVTGGPYQPGYGAPIPPAKSSSKSGWIIGGVIIGVVVLLVCGIGVWLVVKSPTTTKPGTNTSSSSSDNSTSGKYKIVQNLCEKVDATKIPAALGTPTGDPSHASNDSSYYKTMSCTIQLEGVKYNSGNISINVQIDKNATEAKKDYGRGKEYDDKKNETGRTQSAVTDLGETAYQVVEIKDYSSFQSVSYELHLQDSNASVDVRMHTQTQPGQFDPVAVATAIKAMTKSMLDAAGK